MSTEGYVSERAAAASRDGCVRVLPAGPEALCLGGKGDAWTRCTGVEFSCGPPSWAAERALDRGWAGSPPATLSTGMPMACTSWPCS